MALTNTFYVTFATGSLTADITDTSNWGVSGNPVVGDVVSDDLVIALPDNSTYLPDVNNTVAVDLFALGFPAASPVGLTSVDFGQALVTDQIPTGIYQFERTTVVDDGSGEVEYTTTWNGYNYKPLECCADNLSKSGGCGCGGKGNCLPPKKLRVMLMRADFYSIALNERYCQDNIAAADAMVDANDLCQGGACKNCGCS